MMDMDIDAVNYEPPTKTTKIDVHQYPSLYVKLHFTGLFDMQKARSVIHSEPSKQRDKTPLLFRQMAFNLIKLIPEQKVRRFDGKLTAESSLFEADVFRREYMLQGRTHGGGWG